MSAKTKETGLIIDAIDIADKLSEQVDKLAAYEENEELVNNIRELVNVSQEQTDEIERARFEIKQIFAATQIRRLATFLDRWEKIL